MPPSLREGDREAVEGAVELPQSLRDSPLREWAKENASLSEGGGTARPPQAP